MRPNGLHAGFRQILPLLAVISLVCGNLSRAEEKFPNELASPIDEPLVVIPESHKAVPVRPASRAIQESSDSLVKLVYDTREAQRRRLLSTTEHTPWQIMHGLVGLRQDLLLKQNGETVNGLEWIAKGQMYQNEPWFSKTPHGGEAHPFNKPYWFEGHINQSVAIISMCGVPLDFEFGTQQGPVTMRELLKNAQMTVNEKEEVTWTLWALSRYLPPDAEWVNAKGEQWSIERLVKIEVGKTVGGPTSPCGGAHGLFALAHARNVYLRTGKPLRGVWMEAEIKIQKYIQTARLQQNTNGSLSSSFFKGREYKQDFDKRMASCGHLLEFLMMALPQNKLNEPWVRRAIETTANDLMANRKAYVSCSPLYHATNALSIYLDRVAPSTDTEVAQKPTNTKSISNLKELKPAETTTADASKPGVVTDGTAAKTSTAEIPAPGATKPTEPATTPSLSQPMPTPAETAPQSTPPAGTAAEPVTPAEVMPLTIPAADSSDPPVVMPATGTPPTETPGTTPAIESAEPPVQTESAETTATEGENSSVPLVTPASVAALATSPNTTSLSSAADAAALATQSVSRTVVKAAPSTAGEASAIAESIVSNSDAVAAPLKPSEPTAPDGGGNEAPGEENSPGAWKATPPDRRKPIVLAENTRPV